MSIEIYKVNNLFTIKRVSVCVWVGVYRQMECLGRDVNRMVCEDGIVWGCDWIGKGDVGWGEDVKFGWVWSG